MDPSLKTKLASITGNDYFITAAEKLYTYSNDCTSEPEITPGAVIIPGNVDEISQIIKLCNVHKIPVTVRGGGTGVSGGALAYNGGIILSLERLNKIIEINTIDRTATAEAGVITQVLQDAALDAGLCFPQNISSASSCFIGGNVAVSSGSPKSLKYGTTKNYVINLEVVLPDGQILWTGKNVRKNASGYNLTQLFAGSEGTLGIITKVVLKLVPKKEELLMLLPFSDINGLFDFVHDFFSKGYVASSIEFIDKKGYEIVTKHLGRLQGITDKTEGLLWIELEGKDQQLLMEEALAMNELISKHTKANVLIAQTKKEIADLWEFRKKIGAAVMNYSSFRDIDIVVPCSQIHRMYKEIANAASKYELEYTAFGHIGDGNFHVNILYCDTTPGFMDEVVKKALVKIYMAAANCGGTISGEHGIGHIQLPYLPLAMEENTINLMKKIKTIVDPNGILNAKKIF